MLVDSFVSTSAGFVLEIKGTLANKRIYYRDVAYVNLQEDDSNWETLKAKFSVGAYALRLVVRVTHYHADNCRFADNAFIED